MVNATAINFHVLIQVRGAYFSKYSSGDRGFCVDADSLEIVSRKKGDRRAQQSEIIE